MSVVLETTYEGETFEVEVFHDGHIEFPDRDLRHEQAMAEFTDSESPVLQFCERWGESPTKAIFENFELPKDSPARLAADYAERVLHIYEDKCRDDLRPRNAINAARKFVAGEIDRPTLEKAAWVAEAAADSAAAAAAYNVSSEADSPEWQRARDVEVAWQIRRFVDVMEAIGQGFDWPDMKVTP